MVTDAHICTQTHVQMWRILGSSWATFRYLPFFLCLNPHFLPRPSIQKKSKPWWPEDLYRRESIKARRSLLTHQKETPRETATNPWLEKQSAGANCPAFSWPSGGVYLECRGWALPGATGEIVPKVSGTLGFWTSLSWEAGFPQPVASASWVQLLSANVVHTVLMISASFFLKAS